MSSGEVSARRGDLLNKVKRDTIWKSKATDRLVGTTPSHEIMPLEGVSMKEKYTRNKSTTRKDEIIEIATKLFADRGYHVATLDDVAKQLEVTKAALYYHIRGGKEEILREICNRVMKRVTRDILKIQRSSLSPREKLRQVIHELVGLAAEGREEAAIIFEQTGGLSARTHKLIQHHKKEVERSLQEVLKEGVQQGDFAIDDVRITSFAILGLCNWTYHWYRSGGEFTSEQIADTYIHILEKGCMK